MSKPRLYKHSHLEIVNVKWDTTSSKDVIRFWPKSYLIGAVNKVNYKWCASDLRHNKHREGQAKTYERARHMVTAFLIECSKQA